LGFLAGFGDFFFFATRCCGGDLATTPAARSKRSHASGYRSTLTGVDFFMKIAAINQAKERLERARDALKRMDQATTFAAFEKPWADFLQASSGIYSKLQQGAKGCPISEGWFGRKKHDRKKDALLSYLHHARNTDEHGISGTTLQYQEIKILNDKVQGLQTTIDADGNSVVRPIGEGAEIEILKRYTALHAVKDDRYGDSFMPPFDHLGKPIGDPNDQGRLISALDVSRLGLAYMEGLFIEDTKLHLRS
jgi:hypothetical protein